MSTRQERAKRYPNGSNPHTDLVNRSLVELCKKPNTRAWKMQGGMFRAMNHDGVIQVGVLGFSDIDSQMLTKSGKGVRVCYEIKTGKATQSEQQKRFEKMITGLGAFYFVIRSEDDLHKTWNKVFYEI